MVLTANGSLVVSLERRKELDLRLELVPLPSGEWSDTRKGLVGVSYGLGAAGITTGAVTGALALVTSNDVQDRCEGNVCPESERPNQEKADALATASTVSLVVGAAGLVAGTTFALWFWPEDPPRPADEARSRGPVLEWSVGPGRIGLNGSF